MDLIWKGPKVKGIIWKGIYTHVFDSGVHTILATVQGVLGPIGLLMYTTKDSKPQAEAMLELDFLSSSIIPEA